MIIKAISLWEPWATLMRIGAKTIETRSWSTNYRGPLLICASKKQDKGSLRLIYEPAFKRALGLIGPPSRGFFHFGKAVCIVDLVQCLRTEDVGLVAMPERDFGDYSFGRFAWITKNRRLIEPFPVKGRQGLFNVELPEKERLK